MIKDQSLADMTITLGSIDPCFSCTDRLETLDLKSGKVKVWSRRNCSSWDEPYNKQSHENLSIICAVFGGSSGRAIGSCASQHLPKS